MSAASRGYSSEFEEFSLGVSYLLASDPVLWWYYDEEVSPRD